jgi:DUF4097 and DUF4098 domain-containing protein YvlB
MKTLIPLALALAVANTAQAWECKYERELDQRLDVSSSSLLAVRALAGDLEITGVTGLDEIRIGGTACASKAEWLDEISIEVTGGDEARVDVRLPDTDGGWSFWGSRYAYVDLELEVPDDLAVELRDSSGDIELRRLHQVSVVDSSGDMRLVHLTGTVTLEDSSGDILVEDLDGDLLVLKDSSGDIRGRDITGSAVVRRDSSGDIRFSDVGSDVTVERDSSGDITVASVAGDFTVLQDGSGRISSRDVAGEVRIPD